MFFWAKYGTQTDFRFPMVKRGVVDLAATADWTPATGDTKVSKDGGNYANSTNNPAAVAGTGSVGWKVTLTATELQCAELNLQIVDSPTKAVEDQFITIYTYGNASAKVQVDLSDVVRAGLTALPNAAAGANGGLPLGDASGRVDLGKILGTAAAAPATAGILEVNVKNFNNLAAVALPLVPTVAGRTLDVSAGGEAGLDWANVGSPTTVLGLSGTTVKTATDVETKATDVQARLPAALTANGNMKSSMVEILTTALTETVGQLAGGFKKFFNIGTPASTMDALTLVATATNLTNAPTNGDLTATMKTSVTTAATAATPTAAAVTAAVNTNANATETAIKAKTDSLTFTVANQVDSNVLTGGGSGLDAAGTRAALGMASANLDTQLAATAQDSTVAKDATVAKAATVATAASVAALNNLSVAQVRTEAKGAIADYGGIL